MKLDSSHLVRLRRSHTNKLVHFLLRGANLVRGVHIETSGCEVFIWQQCLPNYRYYSTLFPLAVETETGVVLQC
jgi:hypothetical protein